MKLNVTSEIGRLKRVLVHLPGREIDVMVPEMMEELLFDDILYGQLAREEHRRFQQIMWHIVEDVVDIADLLEETLEDDDARALVIDDITLRYGVPRDLVARLRKMPTATLADTLIGGIVHERRKTGGPPAFDIPPVPNLFFMRDPQFVIGDRACISSMATPAREREALLSRYVFRHHKAFRENRDILWTDLLSKTPRAGSRRRRPTLEGGDVLVARRDILIVGLSERTNRAGIEQLASDLKKADAGVKTILVVEIPKQRSFMHLDTVFTIINRNECLMYPPVIHSGGSEEAQVFQLDLSKREISYTAQKSLLGALKRKGMDLAPIFCGGARAIDQQREQWTDGANAFVLAPGIILLYERNVQTAAELDRHGYHVVYEDDLLLGRTELETWTDKKYAIQIQGTELSRARGGPRCMTMPLEREEI